MGTVPVISFAHDTNDDISLTRHSELDTGIYRCTMLETMWNTFDCSANL
jgi:hypothetical protein